jgi:hypothetical protein
MSDFWACTVAEVKALGAWCMIHGPEIWLGIVIWCVLSAAVVLGMWLAALLSANGRDEDENKRDL